MNESDEVKVGGYTSNFYCKIFIDSNSSKEQIIQEIASITGGSIRRNTIISAVAEFDVEDNEDFLSVAKDNPIDGFLYYRYYIDVEPNNIHDIIEDDYINLISMVIEKLWIEKRRTVAACDFEDKLPRKV